MTSSHQRTAVPTDVEHVASFTEDFRERYGVAPIAGGETIPTEPAPPTEPAEQAPPQEADPAAPMSEATAQQLIARFDQMGPVEPPDPFLTDLGLVAPPPAMPGQPQAQPGAQPPPGQFEQPQAPGLPQQPGAPLPGPQQEREAIQNWIDERATAKAEELIEQRINPRFEQAETDRRRAEIEGFIADNPELQDPQKAGRLMATAKNWSRQLSGSEDLAREPGFLELTYRANRDIIASQARAAQQPPAQPGPNGEVPIEQPGPAAPAGANGQVDKAQAIVEAGKGHGLNPIFL